MLSERPYQTLWSSGFKTWGIGSATSKLGIDKTLVNARTTSTQKPSMKSFAVRFLALLVIGVTLYEVIKYSGAPEDAVGGAWVVILIAVGVIVFIWARNYGKERSGGQGNILF